MEARPFPAIPVCRKSISIFFALNELCGGVFRRSDFNGFIAACRLVSQHPNSTGSDKPSFETVCPAVTVSPRASAELGRPCFHTIGAPTSHARGKNTAHYENRILSGHDAFSAKRTLSVSSSSLVDNGGGGGNTGVRRDPREQGFKASAGGKDHPTEEKYMGKVTNSDSRLFQKLTHP